MIEESDRNRRIAAVEWYIVRHYLQGCRYFDSVDYATGVVRPAYYSARGGVPFKYEEIVNKLTTEVGRMMRLDIAPSITRSSTGLDGLRTESTSQAVLNAIYPHLDPEGIKRSFFTMLTMYGVAGLLAYQESKDDTDPQNPAANVAVEVVPPWELLFLPASAPSLDQVSGFVRRRWVRLDWLRTINLGKATFEELDDTDPELDVKWVKAGVDFSMGSASSPTESASTKKTREGRKPGDHKDDVAWVLLQEVWCRFRNGRLRSYDIRVGQKLAHNKDYQNKSDTPMIPVSVAIRAEGIGQYGRSFIAPLIYVNAEIEGALVNLFRNARDFDLMGLVGIPSSWGVSRHDLEATGPGGNRFFFLERDPMKADEQPVHIAPATSGDLPTKIGDLGIRVMDRLSQQPEIITQGQAPGRVDSTPALNFLYQASTLPLGGLASSVASAFGSIYKALLQFAKKWDNFYLNAAALADDAIIGLSMKNYDQGIIQLDTNALPDPVTLNVGIDSQKPVDKDSRKQELIGLLTQQLISPQQFRITARLEKLDMPLMNDTEWQCYRKAVLRNIILFNDGKTPGELEWGLELSDYDMPEIHLMVVNRLLSSPEFSYATEPVQTKFNNLSKMLQDRMGGYPDQLEYPEEMEEGMQGGQQQGGAPQGPEGGAGGMGGLAQMLGGMGGGGGGQGANPMAALAGAAGAQPR